MIPFRSPILLGLVLGAAGLWLGIAATQAGEPADPDGEEFFEKKVRPVLVTHCQKCHGPNEAKNGLRVDSLAALVAGGDTGPAVVPGKPEESLLIGAVQHGELYQMPPKTKLPGAVIADLVAWVKRGAPWPNASAAVTPKPAEAEANRPLFSPEDKAFWAFQPPLARPLPAVRDDAWCQSPIDRFILAGLESHDLAPAPPADKRTLIRRVTFDLLGIPPTPDEVQAFLQDDSPLAFARLVDRLLASPHYGERWGRHWLDVARYADSNGMDENVAYANAWRYRDYVIAALNKDKPYDRFVREQLAGDLLAEPGDDRPEATIERLTATGFLVIGPKMLAEDDPRKMEMDIVDEQLDTVGRTFLGLTLGCARCHDHKFDPLPTADYYSLAGIFKSTKTMENFRVVAMWHERPIATPEASALRQERLAAVQSRKDELAQTLAAAKEALLAAARPKAERYFVAAQALARQKSTEAAPLMTRDGAADTPGLILLEAEKFDRGNVVRDYSVYGDAIGVIYNDGNLPNFAEYDFTVPTDATYQLELRYAAADERPIELLLDGKSLKSGAAGRVTGGWQPDKQAWSTETVVRLSAGKHTLRLQRAEPVPHLDKLALVPVSHEAGESAAGPQRSFDEWVAAEELHPFFLRQWVKHLREAAAEIDAAGVANLAADPKGPFSLPTNDKELDSLLPQQVRDDLKRRREAIKQAEQEIPPLPSVMAASEGKVETLRVHLRGNYLTLDREAPRQFPRILAGENQTPIDAARSGRLELAAWMTRPDHPLTARVMVNRVWHWHFGNGLVRSPDNFGRLGEKPDHPELLDWLALRLVEQGWSLKQLHREILLSSTYQMGTAYNAAAFQADPENRLHWRADRRRLEAEALRDAVLVVCDQLDTHRGGTLLKTANHAYVTSTASEKLNFFDGARRSVYLPVTRSSVYELFQAFDFADPSAPNGQRATTTIAPQALALMNSRLLEEQTGRLAALLLAEPALDDAARVRSVYERAFSRPPTDAETATALRFVERIAQTAAAASPAEARHRAWQSLCRVVLASSEFIYVE